MTSNLNTETPRPKLTTPGGRDEAGAAIGGEYSIVATSGALPATGHPATGVSPVLPDAGHARKLIDLANAKHDIQTSFVATPKPDPHAAEFWHHVFEGLGNFFEGVGKLFAPLAPVLPYLLYLLGFAVLALLLSPVVRLFLTTRFERLFSGHQLKAETPWRPTREAVVALLHDIDTLAAQGSYDEAVHLLLVRSVADINAYRPDMVRPHVSAREICTHPLLPEGARPAFTRIVEWVEKSYFAGLAVGKAGFDACRQAYVDFVAAEGIK